MKSRKSVYGFGVFKLMLFSIVSVLLFCITSCQKTSNSDISKEFSGVTTVDLSTVSGDCKIVKSNNSLVKVYLTHDYKPSNSFEPIFMQNDNVLKLQESMIGSSSGSSEWVISVPEHINIICTSSSGNINVVSVALSIKAVTSSGDIIAKGIKFIDNSEFVSSSGDVDITLSESPSFNVLVSTSSGDATINYNKYPVVGTIKMRARVAEGDIISPYEFDTEKEDLLNDQEYMIKSFSLESELPIIKIHTASGEACLRK